MGDCMTFPDDYLEFIKSYSFKDTEEIYTNGSELISVLRVQQMIEHYFPNENGWISVKNRLPEPDVDALWCAKYEPERVNAIRYTDKKWDMRIDSFTGHVNHGIPEVYSYGEACIPLYWMPLPAPPKDGDS